MLPQIGNEKLYEGDSVTCGLCLHSWTPIPLRTLPQNDQADKVSVPVALKAHTANAGTELPVGGFMCVRCAQQMDDCKCNPHDICA